MENPTSSTPKEPQEIEQLSHAELVLMVLGLQKIIATLTEKLAIAQGKGQSNSQTSSKPPSTDLISEIRETHRQTGRKTEKETGWTTGTSGKN